jgi:hypothetical protein
MGLALEVGGESKEGFNYDYPIEINEQSLEKTNNSYIEFFSICLTKNINNILRMLWPL